VIGSRIKVGFSAVPCSALDPLADTLTSRPQRLSAILTLAPFNVLFRVLSPNPNSTSPHTPIHYPGTLLYA
jgi:hypothetical protein